MEPIYINTPTASYPIHIETSFDRLHHVFADAGLSGFKVCIISDSHVAPLYLDTVQKAIAPEAREISSIVFEAGEPQKHLGTISRFYDHFLEHRLDRSSVVVALGGGVTGDMAGFAAATYMRGIPFVQLPTSLLAQVDASVGGKTGVDHNGVKNLIGAFNQPRFVYINLSVLPTLPPDEFRSGLGEVVKHGLIGDSEYYQFIIDNKQAIRQLEPEALCEVVAASCCIKAAVVSQDEKESGLRETLNLGHTFGHAVESLKEYILPHGHCVSIGLCAAMFLSFQLGHVTQTALEQTVELLDFFGLPVREPSLTPEALYRLMFTDKKTKNDTLRLILINNEGRAYTDDTISKPLVMAALEYIT